MANFDNITKLNYKNEIYELDGTPVEEVLEMLDLDLSQMNLEVEDDTLYIVAKTGTKGADDAWFHAILTGGYDDNFDALDEPEKEEDSKRIKVEFDDGKLKETSTRDDTLEKLQDLFGMPRESLEDMCAMPRDVRERHEKENLPDEDELPFDYEDDEYCDGEYYDGHEDEEDFPFVDDLCLEKDLKKFFSEIFGLKEDDECEDSECESGDDDYDDSESVEDYEVEGDCEDWDEYDDDDEYEDNELSDEEIDLYEEFSDLSLREILELLEMGMTVTSDILRALSAKAGVEVDEFFNDEGEFDLSGFEIKKK